MNNEAIECCAKCKFCCEFYTPPTKTTEAKHEYCCTLFLHENSVMYLGMDILGMCECFDERKS